MYALGALPPQDSFSGEASCFEDRRGFLRIGSIAPGQALRFLDEACHVTRRSRQKLLAALEMAIERALNRWKLGLSAVARYIIDVREPWNGKRGYTQGASRYRCQKVALEYPASCAQMARIGVNVQGFCAAPSRFSLKIYK